MNPGMIAQYQQQIMTAAMSSGDIEKIAEVYASIAMPGVPYKNMSWQQKQSIRQMVAALRSGYNGIAKGDPLADARSYMNIHNAVAAGGFSGIQGMAAGVSTGGMGMTVGAGYTSMAVAHSLNQLAQTRSTTLGGYNVALDRLSSQDKSVLIADYVRANGMGAVTQHLMGAQGQAGSMASMEAAMRGMVGTSGNMRGMFGEGGTHAGIGRAYAARQFLDAQALIYTGKAKTMAEAQRIINEPEKYGGYAGFETLSDRDKEAVRTIAKNTSAKDRKGVFADMGTISFSDADLDAANMQVNGQLTATTIDSAFREKLKTTMDQIGDTVANLKDMFGAGSMEELKQSMDALHMGSLVSLSDVKKAKRWMTDTRRQAEMMNLDVKEVIAEQTLLAQSMPGASAEQVLRTQTLMHNLSEKINRNNNAGYTSALSEEEQKGWAVENQNLDINSNSGLIFARAAIAEKGHRGMSDDQVAMLQATVKELETTTDPNKRKALNARLRTMTAGYFDAAELETLSNNSNYWKKTDMDATDASAAEGNGATLAARIKAKGQLSEFANDPTKSVPDLITKVISDFGTDYATMEKVFTAVDSGDFDSITDPALRKIAEEYKDMGINGKNGMSIIGAIRGSMTKDIEGRLVGNSRYERDKAAAVTQAQLIQELSEGSTLGVAKDQGILGNMWKGFTSGKEEIGEDKAASLAATLYGDDSSDAEVTALHRQRRIDLYKNAGYSAEEATKKADEDAITSRQFAVGVKDGKLTDATRKNMAAYGGVTEDDLANMTDDELWKRVQETQMEKGNIVTVEDGKVSIVKRGAVESLSKATEEARNNQIKKYFGEGLSQEDMDKIKTDEVGNIIGYTATAKDGSEANLLIGAKFDNEKDRTNARATMQQQLLQQGLLSSDTKEWKDIRGHVTKESEIEHFMKLNDKFIEEQNGGVVMSKREKDEFNRLMNKIKTASDANSKEANKGPVDVIAEQMSTIVDGVSSLAKLIRNDKAHPALQVTTNQK